MEPESSKSKATIDTYTFERLPSSEETIEEKQDEKLEPSLRPISFDEYPGQEKSKNNLKVYVKAAKRRKTPLDHVILHGPPGLGKTTLAKIVANELSVPFYQISAPSIDKPGDLAGILAGIETSGVLFIDEIHRLSIMVEEVLYSAMEDFNIDIIVGQGATARTVKMPINPFTLIGATTRVSLLSPPLVSRFGIQERLEFYSIESLTEIIVRSSIICGINISESGARELALRSRGTPRIANRLLRRARDFADYSDLDTIDGDTVKLTLKRLEIDECGLDHMDIKIMRIIRDRYKGGPVGLDTLSSTVGEVKSTIEEVYEPYLLHQGYIERGPRGRALSDKGWQHLEKMDKGI